MKTQMKLVESDLRCAAVVAVVVCLAFAFPASADTPPELPAAFTSLASYVEAPKRESATRHADELLDADAHVDDALNASYGLAHKLKLVNFSREVEVLKEDVTVKVQSPGKRKSLMMVELKF